MATLEEVLAALNAAGMDAREVLSKLPEIATTNGDVPFTFSDGTQITLPGLPKLKAEVDGFIAGAETTIKRWWSSTFYIDPVDGSDDNPGTSNAPFATIAKAINVVPSGGMATLYLANTAPHMVPSIWVNRKFIRLARWNKTGSGERALMEAADTFNPVFRLVGGSILRIRGGIDFKYQINESGGVQHWRVPFKTAWDYGPGYVFVGDWTSDGSDTNTIYSDNWVFHSESTFGVFIFYNTVFKGAGGSSPYPTPRKIGLGGSFILRLISCTLDTTVFDQEQGIYNISGSNLG